MRPIRWLRRGLLLAGLGAAGGALFVTARHVLETPQPLRSGLAGEGRIDRKHGGDIYYNVAGADSADPIVLLHNFYPGASNYEYRHLFARLAPAWRVYAPDWLGFGMSEHPALAYTGEFYANMLLGFLRDVVDRPAVVVGHGRAANIAARAAADAPDLFSRLILVSPDVAAGVELEPRFSQALARASQRVSLGLVPYAFLSTKPLLRRLAHRQSAHTGEESASEETVEHLYASAHQFGGQHAQLALMTGELDLPIQNIFPLLQPPVLLISGDEDPDRPLAVMEDLAILNPHADLDVLTSAGDAVFEDQPAMFAEALLDWLATAPTRQQPQIEGEHPAMQADDTPAPLAPVAPVAPVAPDAPEPETIPETLPDASVGTDSAKNTEATETPGTPGTSAPPDASETTADVVVPSDEPTAPAPKKSASAPATRTTAGATSKAASSEETPDGEPPQRAAKQAARQTTRKAQSSATTRPKADTSEARAVSNRSVTSDPGKLSKATKTSKKGAKSANPDGAPRKKSGKSRTSDGDQ